MTHARNQRHLDHTYDPRTGDAVTGPAGHGIGFAPAASPKGCDVMMTVRQLQCASCGRPFEARRRDARTCSKICSQRLRRGAGTAAPSEADQLGLTEALSDAHRADRLHDLTKPSRSATTAAHSVRTGARLIVILSLASATGASVVSPAEPVDAGRPPYQRRGDRAMLSRNARHRARAPRSCPGSIACEDHPWRLPDRIGP